MTSTRAGLYSTLVVNAEYDRALRKVGWTVTAEGCWEWNGSRQEQRGGYGQLRIDGTVKRASRVAYEAWVGPLGDLFALHHCDNPPCINPGPGHLYAGTPKTMHRTQSLAEERFSPP